MFDPNHLLSVFVLPSLNWRLKPLNHWLN